MDDEEILACVAEVLGLPHLTEGGTVTPLSGKQGLLVCRVSLPGGPSSVFKAVKHSCRNELPAAAFLAHLSPQTVPEVLHAREDDRRGYYWLVMRDEGDGRLSDNLTLEGYTSAARTLARLQLDALPAVDDLTKLGVRSMQKADWEEMALGLIGALENGAVPFVGDNRVLADCLWMTGDMALDATAVPPTVVHGDLHPGNIVIRCNGDARLLDWGSAYVAPAFLGLAELIWPAERYLRSLGGFGPMRKAYLDCWIPLLGKPGRLERAIRACEALARLSLVHESLRHAEEFGSFAAASMSAQFVDSCRRWERAGTC